MGDRITPCAEVIEPIQVNLDSSMTNSNLIPQLKAKTPVVFADILPRSIPAIESALARQLGYQNRLQCRGLDTSHDVANGPRMQVPAKSLKLR